MHVTFFRLGNFSAIMSSSIFYNPFSFFYSFGTPCNVNVSMLDVLSDVS